MNHVTTLVFLISSVLFVASQERISILGNINSVPSNAIVTQVSVEANRNLPDDGLYCPSNEVNTIIFSIPCARNDDCKFLGKRVLCCSKKCIGGVKAKENAGKSNLKRSDDVQVTEPTTTTTAPLKLMCPTILDTKSQSPGLFSITCAKDPDCLFLGKEILCCNGKCAKGIFGSDVKESAPAPAAIPSKIIAETGKLVCPSTTDFRPQLPLFSIPCQTSADCKFLGKGLLCCNKKCINGVIEVQTESIHAPRFFGLIDTICPKEQIAEVLEVKICKTDIDCGGRICCPDKNGKSYCRTPAHRFDKIPGSKRFEEPIRNLVSFMQCTAPPPPLIDLFPKACKNNFDCFPNLCCQENGKKYCRPPKKSFLAAVVTRLGTSPVAKSFIARITT